MADRLIENLDNLETLICRDLPDSLDRRTGLETIKETRIELIDLWHEIANPEIPPLEECPKCGEALRCRDCGWRTP